MDESDIDRIVVDIDCPRLHPDGDPADLPFEVTLAYNVPTRGPARPLWVDWPVTFGMETGAMTDAIADSLAAGDQWQIGAASECAASDVVIWLLPVDTPYHKQLVAWRVRRRQCAG